MKFYISFLTLNTHRWIDCNKYIKTLMSLNINICMINSKFKIFRNL